jgi:hypothetical protein
MPIKDAEIVRVGLTSTPACRKPRDVSASYKVDAAQPLGRAPTPKERRPVDTQSPIKGTAPAVMKALDGNEATANIAYALSDVCFIYPITPSTPMGESADAWAAEGRKNLHGNVMQVCGQHTRRAIQGNPSYSIFGTSSS